MMKALRARKTMGGRSWAVMVCAAVFGGFGSGCVTARPRPDAPPPPPPRQEVRIEQPLEVKGDLELMNLNDEELFATGSSAFAAGEYQKAARYFDRILEFHPQSPHRRQAMFNSGLAHEKLEQWSEAHARFAELADAEKGQGDALDAAYRLAETLYHQGRYDEAEKVLGVLARRADLPVARRMEAQVQQGICQHEAGRTDDAEATLRKALATYNALADRGEVDDYVPAQAEFFLGEIYRFHYESVKLDPDKGTHQLSEDLELKAQLLLSAQGHYLRSIRIGNGYWATASGSQIGGLYESFYEHMINSPAPSDLNAEEAEVYRQELRKKIRVLVTKAIDIYERTLEAAERIGARNAFVEKTRENLRKMKELLVADAAREEQEAKEAQQKPAPRTPPKKGGAPKDPRT
jgi:tetratricopeptide (TPR) repeat protein